MSPLLHPEEINHPEQWASTEVYEIVDRLHAEPLTRLPESGHATH